MQIDVRRLAIPVVLVGLVLAALGWRSCRRVSAPDAVPDDPALATTIARLRVVAAGLESYSIENNQYPVPTGASLDELEALLVPSFLSRLPREDGWGGPLEIKLDLAEYELRARNGEVALGARGDLRVPVLPPGSALARTIAREQLRVIAAAVASYSIDNNAYPVPESGELASVAALLEPTYIARVPPTDPWGEGHVLEVDGARFRVISAGPDRRMGAGDDDLEASWPDAQLPDISSTPDGGAYALSSSGEIPLGDDTLAPDFREIDGFLVRHPRAREVREGWWIDGWHLAVEAATLATLEAVAVPCVTEPSEDPDLVRLSLPEGRPLPPGAYTLRHGKSFAPGGSFSVSLAAPLAAAARSVAAQGESGDADVLVRVALRFGAPRAAVEDLLLPPGTPPNRKREMGDVRTVATALEARAVDVNSYPVRPSLVPVDDVASLLEPTYIRRLPRVDSWDRSFLYQGATESFRLIALGRDGALDDDSRDPASIAREVRSPDEDVVFDTGQFVRWSGSSRDGLGPRGDFLLLRDLLVPDGRRAAETLATLREVGIAIESHAIDNEMAYPDTGTSLEALADALAPTYIGRMPRWDAWGEPLEVNVTTGEYELRAPSHGLAFVNGRVISPSSGDRR